MIRQTVGNIFKTLAFTAQRFNIRLPTVILTPLRLLLLKLVENKADFQDVADWSQPLIAGREMKDAAEISIMAPQNLEASIISLPPVKNPSDSLTLAKKPQKSLKCLLVTSALDAGGMDEVVVFLARGLLRYNIQTAVLHASMEGSPDGTPSGRLGRLLLEYGVEAVELDPDRGMPWLEAWRPDVISAHGAPSWVLDAATRLSIPYFDTLHGMHSHFGADWAIENERSQRLTGIVAVSELVRQQYLNGNPAFPPERIVTIPNSVDAERRIPCDRNSFRSHLGIQDEYLFVSLARHCLQKNTYGLVAAFADVVALHPEAHLVIAGRPDDPMYFSQLLRLRKSLACKDRIHLRDHMPNPAQLLAASDGFVLNSFFEGWSLASMEALYAGIPVVLSEVGGAREQVGDSNERGYVIPNPLGDPLRVNWETMREASYARQVNRETLIAAISSLITNRETWLEGRQRLISESAVRFHPDISLSNHARVLRTATYGEFLRVGEEL
ncbi:glycosyltransferase family 4 protein [Methyloglobulus sp.]|uniref:glycosyltransferase family 4 protein n=1 Tax=Methyloglobulus sp. TaxID=2518622 RepID=UPI0032B7B2D0